MRLPGWHGDAQAAWQTPELLGMSRVLCSAALKVLIVLEHSMVSSLRAKHMDILHISML
jgi:hypothetical protein